TVVLTTLPTRRYSDIMKKIKASSDINVEHIARGTPGFSGADLANLVNEAALFAARRDQKEGYMKDMEDAKDKIMMGAERKSMVKTEDDKRIRENGKAQ